MATDPVSSMTVSPDSRSAMFMAVRLNCEPQLLWLPVSSD